jgi:hypothetical protein
VVGDSAVSLDRHPHGDHLRIIRVGAQVHALSARPIQEVRAVSLTTLVISS